MAFSKVILMTILLAVGGYSQDSEGLQFINRKTEEYKQHEEMIEAKSAEIEKIYSPPKFDECEDRPDDGNNCGVECEIQTPYVIRNNTVDYLVLQGPNFKQTIRSTSCMSPKASCFKDVVGSDDIEATCKTFYTKMTVYVYEMENGKGKAVPKIFPIPTCCKCTLRNKNYGF